MEFTYKDYVLDDFQIKAIAEIENGHSLVLSAPTGSGKTLVAEYLIDKVLQGNKRIIYTSPIKALSNQKYRDFSALYGDKVGILTGDVVINRDAQALIVTTEVYRNMAIEDPDAIKDVSYVVFDEIHYLGDIERGTVWEESIIFSPKTVRFLALSATIPNYQELANWIESVIQHQVKAIHSAKRAVPLSFMFYHNKRLMTFKDLKRSAGRNADKAASKLKRTKFEEHRHFEIIKQLRNKDALPLLYFVFSRALADKLAKITSERLCLTTPEEQEIIERMADECIEKYDLAGFDTAQSIKKELLRGVGRHHAGLLPQLKELIEILFAKRIIKVLFVTETFAVGVNMPARSVAYDALKKFDGRSFRQMTSLEFTQISGRAGRRGIDKVGNVIVPYLPFDTELKELQKLVYGDIEPLMSRFDLSFNSVLNLYAGHKNEEVRTILKKNFAQFQANKALPPLGAKIAKIRSDMENVQHRCTEKENDFEEFIKFHRKKEQRLDTLNKQLDNVRFGLRRNADPKEREKVYKDFDAKAAKIREEENSYICGRCKSKKRCISNAFQHSKLERKLEHWQTQFESQEELHLPIYEEKLRILRRLGYIDDKGLLPRGEIASKIHSQEIAVTELYFEGYFHEATIHELNALCLALTFEYRRRGPQNGQENSSRRKNALPPKIRSAAGFIKSLGRRHSFINPLETVLTGVIIAWSEGADFESITEMTDVPEGDLIRAFRQVIDMLRQIREAIYDKDPILRDKIGDALLCINRDIVLATELRD